MATITYSGNVFLSSVVNITTGTGNDELVGRLNDVVLSGGVGADSIFGGYGDDTLNGGAALGAVDAAQAIQKSTSAFGH